SSTSTPRPLRCAFSGSMLVPTSKTNSLHEKGPHEKQHDAAHEQHQRTHQQHSSACSGFLGRHTPPLVQHATLNLQNLGQRIALLLGLHDRIDEVAHGLGGHAARETQQSLTACVTEIELLQDQRKL